MVTCMREIIIIKTVQYFAALAKDVHRPVRPVTGLYLNTPQFFVFLLPYISILPSVLSWLLQGEMLNEFC